MTGHDPFLNQKQESFQLSLPAINSLAIYLIDSVSTNPQRFSSQQLFHTFFQISLWGNKCDLSISHGNQNHQELDPVNSLKTRSHFTLLNHSDHVWDLLSQIEADKPGSSKVSFVLDNAGFELFTDLCLIEFLFASKLVSQIVIYPKTFPWFVSDVTMEDMDWTLMQMVNADNTSLMTLGKRLKERVKSGQISFKVHDFWTYPHCFSKMKSMASDLYSELAQADLIIFKGDLNYRKLTQDRKWEPTTDFEFALGGFQPAPFCVLRTLKSDSVVGLRSGQAAEIEAKDESWMVSGNYAVMQASMSRLS